MRELRIRLLNVGRADCILLQLPDLSWGIIDCGVNRGPYQPHNQAAEFLSNVEPLDSPVRSILATHPHADHDGGIRQLLQLVCSSRRSLHAVYYSGVERRCDLSNPDFEKDDGLLSFVDEAEWRAQRGEITECRLLPICPHVLKAPHHGAKKSIPPDSVFGNPGGERFVMISAPTDSEKHPHREFLSAVPVTPDGWKTRCTGLARACIDKQTPETLPWKPGTREYLPEPLRRSLLWIGGRSRIARVDAFAECCLDNEVTVNEQGMIEHSVRERSCDSARGAS